MQNNPCSGFAINETLNNKYKSMRNVAKTVTAHPPCGVAEKMIYYNKIKTN